MKSVLTNSMKSKKHSLHTGVKNNQNLFSIYYEMEYKPRAEKWALCHRDFNHDSTDTNMFVESFHNKLKTNPRYLAHHANRRVDDLVGVLFSFEEDLFHDRMRKDIMKTTDEASLKCEGNKRHTDGITIPDSAVKVLDEKSYTVASTDGERTYEVHIKSLHCNFDQKICARHCASPDCHSLCRCMIDCTCIDYKQGHICKHTHKVRILSLLNCEAVENDVNDDSFILSNSCGSKLAVDITGRQDAAQKCMKNISSLLQGTDDPDHVLSLLTQASAALKAVSPLSTEQHENIMPPFQVKDHFSPTQKNERQLKIWKTCKSPGRKRQNTLRRPQENSREIWSGLVDSENFVPEVNSHCATITEMRIEKQGQTYSASQQESVHSAAGKRKLRCGECEGCTLDSCGLCVYCLDMKKYGGPGKKKKACEKRECTRLQMPLTDISNQRFNISTPTNAGSTSGTDQESTSHIQRPTSKTETIIIIAKTVDLPFYDKAQS